MKKMDSALKFVVLVGVVMQLGSIPLLLLVRKGTH